MASVNTELKALATKVGASPANGDSNSALIAKMGTAMVAVPAAPADNGTYTLKMTVTSEGATASWVADQL